MRHLISSLTFVVAAGCAGTPPPGDNPQADANTLDSPILEAEGQKVSGVAKDYFGGDPLADATIETDGVTPAMLASSLADGTYALEGVPVGSKIYLSARKTTPLYRPTRNTSTNVADADVVQDVFLLSDADVKRQYTTLGKTPLAGTSFLTAEMKSGNGAPLENITLDKVTLVDANDQPVQGVLGPYFFGAAGDIDPALTTATAFGGRSRVAFLDVPPGSFSLKVAETAQLIHVAPVTSSADGAVLALVGGMGGGGGGNPANPAFATDIYPRLQKASLGGLGCANCHTNGGSGGVLRYDDPAAMVLSNMQQRPGVIDLATPENSLLLTKPLYEPPPALQNHPNATFLDINDPDYKLILLWIQQGALP